MAFSAAFESDLERQREKEREGQREGERERERGREKKQNKKEIKKERKGEGGKGTVQGFKGGGSERTGEGASIMCFEPLLRQINIEFNIVPETSAKNPNKLAKKKISQE